MAIEEIASAVVQIIPSALGIEQNIAKQLAPVPAMAASQGAKAGTSFGSKFAGMLPKQFMGLSFGPLLGSALAAGVIVGLAEIGGAVGKMRRIVAQESGATGAHLDALFTTAKNAAKDVPASFEDIAAAVSELERRGVPLGATFDKLAKQELFLAKITKTDLATNVEATTGLMAKFNIPLRDQSRELDVLFKATQASGKGLDELIAPLVKGGVSLQQFGFDLDHSIALVAGLTRAGVNVQPVLASLRKAFGQIAKEGGDPQKVLAATVKELRDGKNPTLAMANAIKLFGARGGAELARAIQQGKLNVDALFKSITNGKDGIIATGEATLTLGDRITLLKNRAAVALAPLGMQIRNVFSTIVEEASPAISQLFSSIGRLAKELAPALIPVGIALAGIFKGALPVMSTFATGLDAVASMLGHFPTPVLAAASATGALFLAFRALGGVSGLLGAGDAIGAFLAGLSPVTSALIVAAAAVTAIGLAVKIFGSHSDAAKVQAKELGKALFDASNEAGIFAAGIDTANEGILKFLKSQLEAGKDKGLQEALAKGGTTVADLVDHLGDGSRAWERWREDVAISAAGIGSTIAPVIKFNKALDQQRKAFIESAQAQLRYVGTSGELTKKQLAQLVAQNRNADGTHNYGKLLDDVNAKLRSLAAGTDASAQAAADSSPVYSELVRQFASGAISAESFSTVLKDHFKFSAEGAKASVKALGEQVKTLAGEVDKSFPAVADAAKGLTTDVSGAAASLVNRQSLWSRQYKVLTDQGGQASTTMRDKIVENNAGIRADMAVLAANTDPQKFVTNLLNQAGHIATFYAGLRLLIKQGFPALARTLLDLGVQAGGGLVASFAADKNKAAAGNATVKLLNEVKAKGKAQVLADFPEYQGIGKGVVEGVASGIDANASKATAAAQRMSDAVKGHLYRQFEIHSPSKWAADKVGKPIVVGVAQGLDPKPLGPALGKIVSTVKSIGALIASAVPAGVSGALSDFVSAAIGALPTVGSAISSFSSNLTSALDAETSALTGYHAAFKLYNADRKRIPVILAREREATELLHAAQLRLFSDTVTKQPKVRLGADAQIVANAQRALDAARTRLKDARSKVGADSGEIGAAAKALTDAQRAVKAASDVSRFTAGLRASNTEVLRFQGSLQRLVKLGLTDLARNLAEQGPEAAGRLAAALARNTRAARAAERNIDRQKKVAADFQRFLSKNFKGLGGAAAETGTSVAKDLLTGITDYLKATGGKNADVVAAQIRKIVAAPVGKKAGQQLAKSVSDGFTTGLAAKKLQLKAQPVVVQPVKTQPLHAPSFADAVREAIHAKQAAPPPQKLQIVLESAEGMFEPVHLEVDLTSRRVARMKARVRAHAQAIGSP